jgi:hypothetical protein
MASNRHPLVGWGIGLLVGGLLVALIAMIGGYHAVAPQVRLFLASSVSSPSSVDLHLTPGGYAIMEKVGDTTGIGSLSVGTVQPTQISPNDVTVESTSGGSVVVSTTTVPFDFTRGSSKYRTAVEFQIVDEGDYVVAVTTPHARFLVTPQVTSVVGHAAGWLALLALAGLAALAGLVLLIVGLVKQRRNGALGPAVAVPLVAAQAPTAAPVLVSSAAAAGWYADPGGSGRWRWWDGQRWTDHLG